MDKVQLWHNTNICKNQQTVRKQTSANVWLNVRASLCVFAAGAGERHDASEEAAGGAGDHEAALPSNGAEGGGPAGQAGAGRHPEPAQQVSSMTPDRCVPLIPCDRIQAFQVIIWSDKFKEN